ncbi:MAG TPA: FAD-dependent oxidoreductase [Chloroflexota bacterium]|nr:FAD-dependent oxidoreductase [Chloroflexota bacterium]
MDRADIVMIGGGLASAAAAENYRKAGGTGSVLLISQDRDAPVHRPPLSKEYLRGDEDRAKVFVHPPAFYADNQIDLRLGTRVERIDLDRKEVYPQTGEPIAFGTLVLATGARPRSLPVPGGDLPGVFYLRSLASSERLQAAYRAAQRAVVIGAGFIGMEVAATLTQSGVGVTVVEMGSRVWPQIVPPVVSDFIARFYADKGVQFRFGRTVHSIEGNGRAERVRLDGGEILEADLVVAGVGAVLNSELAAAAGLEVNRGVVVDTSFAASHPDVYAIGDIASFPDPRAGRIHLEHWDNALNQGRALGQTLAGQGTPFDHVAYFFSDMFDLSLNMLGYPDPADEIAVRGNPADGRFTTLYLRDGRLRAVLMLNDDAEFDSWSNLIGQEYDPNRQPVAEAS